MWKMRMQIQFQFENLKGRKRPLRRPNRRWEDIKMDFGKCDLGCGLD
jgi:hypothetical protein